MCFPLFILAGSTYANSEQFEIDGYETSAISDTATTAAEDCVSFNPTSATVLFSAGQWKIVDGNHAMFAFGNNESEARQALRIIKAYNMGLSCFVGRPDPSFSYLLGRSRNAPMGALVAGEDCISFNPDLVEAKFVPQGNTWKMVQGNMWMVDFGNKESEARDSVAVVKRYRFNQQCFVGRPQASFYYWKASPTAVQKADLGAYGFLQIGKQKKLVKWNETVTLTPADAFLVSNGVPAFDVYYSDKNYGTAPANNYENQIYLDGTLVSRQFARNANPGQTQEVHTQAYLKPSAGTHTLTLKVDALGGVSESREDNNLFSVRVVFQGF